MKKNQSQVKSSHCTKATNFELFKERCEYWRDALGLWDWDFDYEHNELNEDKDTEIRAAALYLICNRHAMMYLNRKLSDELEPEIINRLALHEILEVLIANLKNSMLTNKVDEHTVEEQTHEVINRLLRYMLKNSSGERIE